MDEDPKPVFPAGSDDPIEVEGVDLRDGDPNLPSAIDKQFAISMFGYIVGSVVILAGIVIFVLGLNESITFEIDGLGVSSKLQTSAAGLVVSGIGLVVIVISKFSVTTHSES